MYGYQVGEFVCGHWGFKGLTRRVYFVKSTPVMESFIFLDERNFKKIQVEVFNSILIFFNILYL